MKDDIKTKDDAELIKIVNADSLDVKITHPMKVAAKVELHLREKKDVRKISRMTLAILILTIILVIITLWLAFLTKEALPSANPQVLRSDQIKKALGDINQTDQNRNK